MSDVLARRYAGAYFELAREAGDIDGWGRHLSAGVAALGEPEVARTLSNPRVTVAQRVTLAQEVGSHTSQQAGNLMRLLVERGRIGLLPDIAIAYQRLADRESGVVRAEVITAVRVDDQLRKAITRALAQKLDREVQTEIRQDADILGGLIIRIGDRVIDNSVRTHLQQLQATLA